MRTARTTRHGPMRTRAAFTLVEMLVVVIIIAILAGMVLYFVKSAGAHNAKAQTVEHIEKVRAAVEEFYAEYGQYPPVPEYTQNDRGNTVATYQPFRYEYPIVIGLNDTAHSQLIGTHKDLLPLFTFGLMSFLLPRFADRASGLTNPPGDYQDLLDPGYNPQWGQNNAAQDRDQSRDINAIRRWSPFLKDITSENWVAKGPFDALGQPAAVGWAYTNWHVTVLDGWLQELHYRSSPPYQTYDIWSIGGDHTDGTADDIHSGAGH